MSDETGVLQDGRCLGVSSHLCWLQRCVCVIGDRVRVWGWTEMEGEKNLFEATAITVSYEFF